MGEGIPPKLKRTAMVVLFGLLVGLAGITGGPRPEERASPGPSEAETATFQKELDDRLAARWEARDPNLLAASILVLTLLAGGVLAWAIRLNRRRLEGRAILPTRPEAESKEARWGVFGCLLVIGFYLALMFVPHWTGLLAWWNGLETFDRQIAIAIYGLSTNLATAGFALWVVRAGEEKLATAGFHEAGSVREVGWGGLGYLLVFPLTGLAILVSRWVMSEFGIEQTPNPAIPLLFQSESWFPIIVLSIGVVLVAPVAEEILFRGFLYPALRPHLGVPGAIGVSAGLFAFIHPMSDWVPILVLGSFLAYLFERRRSIWPPMIVHALHNGVMLTFLFLFRAAVAEG